jgi:hypothetical protein
MKTKTLKVSSKVAHPNNPREVRGRDQEDCDSRPTKAKN